jgi:hypothetical protein
MSRSDVSRSAEGQKDPNPSWWSLLHDLSVDLLGSLLPGLLATCLGGLAVFFALAMTHIALYGKPLLPDAPDGYMRVIDTLHWEMAILALVVAYVIGTVLFRQDPKGPDAGSALTVWMNAKKKERSGLAVQPLKRLPPEFDLPSEDAKPRLRHRLLAHFFVRRYLKKIDLDTQFPYHHLRCYLYARGLADLVPLIPWCPEKGSTTGLRTKMFINMLKIRIIALSPYMARDIVRNEAHVRLATSVWYALSVLRYLSALLGLSFLAPVIMLVVGAETAKAKGVESTVLVSAAYAILLLAFCVTMRWYLRKCIHYMRVREVIYVLETARMTKRLSGVDLLEGLVGERASINCEDCPRDMPDAQTSRQPVQGSPPAYPPQVTA